jgi:transglutaminase-like putative cysteine protease
VINIELQVELIYLVHPPGGDFILNIQPAHTSYQEVVTEKLTLDQPIEPRVQIDKNMGTRFLRLCALPGTLHVSYQATVHLKHHWADPGELDKQPIDRLPLEALSYVYPSRYCESDKLLRFARNQFGNLPPGYTRVQAIMAWVRKQIAYTSNSSSSRTGAVETLLDQVGVCRDFAHLMIALCRAMNIPARYATGTDFGSDPALGPTDFHAYVEVYLGDRWYIFDSAGRGIPMGFVRIGTGRDAADTAFATIFGRVEPTERPMIKAVARADSLAGWVEPFHTSSALSTSAMRLHE